jgi:hypothetical protein
MSGETSTSTPAERIKQLAGEAVAATLGLDTARAYELIGEIETERRRAGISAREVEELISA